jgi:hypothetical protein
VQFSKKNNREAYEKEIGAVKKVFFDDNLNVLKKIRQNASERGIKLREVKHPEKRTFIYFQKF